VKVLLVGINAKFVHSNLAVRYLKAYTNDLPFDCNIKEFSINDRIEKVFENIMEEKPEIIGFSCYIWNIEYVIKLASLIKTLDKKIEIFYGGPEVSYDSSNFLLSNPGDYVIEGEGEETFRNFIIWKLSGSEKTANIEGLHVKKGDNVFFGGNRELIHTDSLIFPYHEKDDLNNKIVYYESSRGCPFSCKYCLSSTIHGVRFLNLDRVLKELQFFMDKKVRLLKFVDRTFNCNTQFAKAIWRFLIDANTDTTFHFEISADLLKDDELEILKAAPKGRFQFEVGVQTTNDDVLNNIDRHVNFSSIKEKVLELNKIKNIKQHLDLIAGLPGENFEAFKKSFNDVYSIKPDEIQLGFLKLLKGSLMREEAEKWGMVYSPYAPYEIFKTNEVTFDEMIKLKRVEEVVDKYYNSQKFNNILNYFIDKYKTPFDFYYSLGKFMKVSGYFDRNISSSDYYKVFLEFNNTEDEILKEIIKFDYLKFNKKKWLPPFLNRKINREKEREIIKKLGNNKDIHVEVFDFDILKYFSEGIIEKDEKYLIFDVQNEENIYTYKDQVVAQ
jgi:radical SAM superfamily enzyme YgiQ (UPF0313 family)